MSAPAATDADAHGPPAPGSARTAARSGVLRFALTLLAGAALGIALPGLALWRGRIDVSAAAGPWPLESTLAPLVRDRAIAAHAPRTRNPYGDDPRAVAAGLVVYRTSCVICHGATGVPVSPAAGGMFPDPPMIGSETIQRRPDGELFWIVKNGIRMTGMPGFGGHLSDDQIWRLVSFIRHAPHVTEAEQADLRSAIVGSPNPQGRRPTAARSPLPR